MERQIWPLHTIHHRRRARIPLGLVELRVRPDGRGDVSDGRHLLLVGRAGLRVVGWQGVGAAEVEGAPGVWARGRGADVDLLRGDGAVVADLPGGDAEGFLAEGVVGKDVGDAEDDDDYPGRNDETPKGRTERVFGGGCLVQIAEDGDTDDDHDDAQGDEAVARGEERPVVGGVALEKRDFGEYE